MRERFELSCASLGPPLPVVAIRYLSRTLFSYIQALHGQVSCKAARVPCKMEHEWETLTLCRMENK